MRFWLAVIVLAAACASRQQSTHYERDPIEVWIPDATTEKDQEEIAKALVGHAPPRHDRIPPHRCLRRVDVLYDFDTSWGFLIDLAMTHARQLDADAVVVRQPYFAPGWGVDEVLPAVVIEVVRYDPDMPGGEEAR